MDELIASIYSITEEIQRALQEENDEELDQLLNERNWLMEKIDDYRAAHPLFVYSPENKRLLEATLQIDQKMAPVLAERLMEIRSTLNQINKNKQVSKKYHPYIKQTNGVFVDSKK